MILSTENIHRSAKSPDLTVPEKHLFSLPEKVLQFGTGVLLRGLPLYFIDKANRKGIFNGRVVVVKSTDKGGTEAFDNQNGLYTLCVRGKENGQLVDKKIINCSISRVVSANSDWASILECAVNKDIQIVISNTTETGIKLVKNDNISSAPPTSFPGKLVAFLYERYNFFNGSPESGVVVLPTELIPNNGTLLKNICVELAQINRLEDDFVKWLTSANDFCNTLVDRIVPGALPKTDHSAAQNAVGYEDDLMIMAEPYRLWAIETSNQRTKELLSFAQVDEGVVITDNIDKHRELKLRLLNASHTFSCALAVWCGFNTVREAMQNEAFKAFISELMFKEIIPTLVNESITEEEANVFANKVLDRFANPFIAHEWLSISMQYSSKLLMRCIPILLSHYKRTTKVPRCIALGMAAYILFMNSHRGEDGKYTGTILDVPYPINDDKASLLNEHWQKGNAALVIHSVLSDEGLWGTNLSKLPEFEKNVFGALQLLKSKEYKQLLQNEMINS